MFKQRNLFGPYMGYVHWYEKALWNWRKRENKKTWKHENKTHLNIYCKRIQTWTTITREHTKEKFFVNAYLITDYRWPEMCRCRMAEFLSFLAKCRDGKEGDRKENSEQRAPPPRWNPMTRLFFHGLQQISKTTMVIQGRKWTIWSKIKILSTFCFYHFFMWCIVAEI
jgi:hypothetical protein